MRVQHDVDHQTDAGIRVLHVDDEQALVELTEEYLEAKTENLSVVTETDPEAALDRVRHERFDCIVSDYQMPRMSGIELLRVVREDHPELPFILFTGRGSEEVASEAISAGVTDYLQKRSSSDVYSVLAQQIKHAVERQRAIERFETFLESAPDSIVIVDADGVIEQVNEQTEDLFGYDRGELIGDPIEVLIPERYRDAHVAHRERYMQDPERRPMGADLELHALKADGTEFPVDIAISPVHMGDRVEVMAAIRDVSARKWQEAQLREREAELERQNERLEDFASVVSHDLRSPLNVAEGNLALARETGDLDHLDAVADAHDRMTTLIGDLLTLARKGRTVEEPVPVALDVAAEEAWHSMSAPDATLRVGGATGTILADRSRLKQLLENLFRNAVEHGSTSPRSQAHEDAVEHGSTGNQTATQSADAVEHGSTSPRSQAHEDAVENGAEGVTVTVDVTRDGFAVADDGPGIPADRRDRVFESGYSSADAGTGFGLAIVRTIAEAHGWTVDVAESAAGGARFEFSGVEFE